MREKQKNAVIELTPVLPLKKTRGKGVNKIWKLINKAFLQGITDGANHLDLINNRTNPLL